MDSSIRISRHGNHIDTLIKKGMELRCAVDSLKAQLDDINRQIADMAVFTEGRNTAWVCGSEYKARVVNRVYEKWDQALLDEAHAAIGEETFALLFKRVWEPVSRRDVQGFLTHGPAELAKRLREARSEKVTASVSFVTQDEKVEDRRSGRHGAPAELHAPAESRAHASSHTESRTSREPAEAAPCEALGSGEFRESRDVLSPRESHAPAEFRESGEKRLPHAPVAPHTLNAPHGLAAPHADVHAHHDNPTPRDIRKERPRSRGSFTEATSPTPFGLPHFLSRAFGSASQV